MHPFERQQFEFLLHTAVERYVERLEQRFRGAEGALTQLRQDPNSQDVWLEEFCDAVFEDFLLNNMEGACFILQAMAQQKMSSLCTSTTPDSTAPSKPTVEAHLRSLARTQFSQLLYNKSLETLEQHSGYQTV